MNTDLQTALTLFLVGMLAVFTILALVVLSGRVLISIVNTYFPDPSSLPVALPKALHSLQRVERKKMAAITAAVEQASRGQATIVKIEREEG